MLSLSSSKLPPLPAVTSFFFTRPPPTDIYTLSLHDALPICRSARSDRFPPVRSSAPRRHPIRNRSEEHTSELQSRFDLVCRLLLEKKNTPANRPAPTACSGVRLAPSRRFRYSHYRSLYSSYL